MVDIKREAALREAIEMLYFGYRSFTNGPDRILEDRGLNRIHHRILYFVGRSPGRSVNDLLRVLAISKQALHLPLRQLTELKLVSNNRAEHDGRVRELRLTEEGVRLEETLTGQQMEQLEKVFLDVGKAAESGWRDVMSRLGERS